MSQQIKCYCDGPGCDTIWTKGIPGTLLVTESGDETGGGGSHDFCAWDCVLRFAAKMEPGEIIPVDGSDDE